MIGEYTRRYKPRDIYQGVIQKNYFREPDFASFKGSSYINENVMNETVIVENNKKLWESNDDKDSSFIISFKRHVLKLTHISMLTCYGHDCAHNIDIYGSNLGTTWELACSIREEGAHFRQNVSNAACRSSYSYQMYKLQQYETNKNGNYKFPIYYLELFGDLYYKDSKFISQCFHKQHSIEHFLLFVFLLR